MQALSRSAIRNTSSYLVAFVVQLVLMIITALITFPQLQKGTVNLAVSSADGIEMLDFSSVVQQLEPPELESVVELQPEPISKVEESSDLESLVTESMLGTSMLETSSVAPETVRLDAQLAEGFFGIRSSGNRIAYIIDMSISMNETSSYQRRFDRAVQELLQSIRRLRPEQQFSVYLFCFKMREVRLGGQLGNFYSPTPENVRKLKRSLGRVRLGAGTDPRESLIAALQNQPTCVYLLTDGEFNGHRNPPMQRRFENRTPAQVARKYNKIRCPIHTIGFEVPTSTAALKRIARESGGEFKFVAEEGEVELERGEVGGG